MSAALDIPLSDPQWDFASTAAPFPLFVAGYGAGKSHAAICRLLSLKFKYPRLNVAYYLPTYDLVSTIGFPRFTEMLAFMGVRHELNRSEKTISIGKGKVIFRTMDAPERIIGYEVADSCVDELDTLPTEKARDVWNKIIARNRQKKHDGAQNTIGVATTPEGFRFVHEMWEKNKKPGYEVHRASTESNAANLPAGYIDNLRAIYPQNLLDAYINGRFVNLQTGTIYAAYDRKLNDCKDEVQPGEIVFIGMDFNVGHMAAVIHVKRDGLPRAVDEIVNAYDTPDMIKQVQARFWKWNGNNYERTRQIRVYPDASGGGRRSVNASETDIALLRSAGFVVSAPDANPPVKDRINAMNGMFCNAEGVRRYLVNADKCPTYADCLEQQAWGANGEPDKKSGNDHLNDGAGYYIHRDYPIISNRMQKVSIGGI